jgi:hypothetical protein
MRPQKPPDELSVDWGAAPSLGCWGGWSAALPALAPPEDAPPSSARYLSHRGGLLSSTFLKRTKHTRLRARTARPRGACVWGGGACRQPKPHGSDADLLPRRAHLALRGTNPRSQHDRR